MSLIEKIDAFLKLYKLKRSDLARISNIPYTTIDGLYKKGTDNIKLSTLRKLSQTMACTIDYLVSDDLSENEEYSMEVSAKEMTMLKKMRVLDERGKKIVEKIVNYEYSVIKK